MSESYTTTSKEISNIRNIRNQYISRESNKVDQLNKLDKKVKRPGKIAASILGVSGTLALGAGMSHIMVWENMTLGLRMGIPGLLVALLSIPVYSKITNSRKKKFAAEVIKISDEILSD